MRKFLLGMVIMLLLVSMIAAAGFGVMYFAKTKETTDLSTQKDLLDKDLQKTQQDFDAFKLSLKAGTKIEEQVIFQDVGMEILVKYPASWIMSLDTGNTEEVVYEPEVGRILTKYKLTLTKSNIDLEFNKLLGPLDGFPNELKKSENDMVDVGNNLVRHSLKGQNNWSYGLKLNCSDYVELLGEVAVNSICISPFFSGFGKYANSATIKTSNAELLAEADKIILGAKAQ